MRSMPLARLLRAALMATLALALMPWREGTPRSWGYARFATRKPAEGDRSIARREGTIAIGRRSRLGSRLKVHPPESLDKPIETLESNCYIGSDERHSETKSLHERKQLKEPS